jgi:hypothetical protein
MAGVAYSSINCTVIKSDGTMFNLTVSPSMWEEKTQGAYSQAGYYNILIPATYTDQPGVFQYMVTCVGAARYPGVVKIVVADATDVYNRLGTPVSTSISADIQNVSAGSSSGGGFGSDDRTTLLAVKAKTDNLPSDPVSTSGIETWLGTNSFNSSDRSNVNAIKAKTDNLPAAPAAVGDVTSAVTSINSNTDSRATELKGGSGWVSGTDSLHNIQIELAAVKLKTDNLPATPAAQSDVTALAGTGFSAATDSLHQLQLSLTGIVSGSGGFTADDRAALNAINAVMPASVVSTQGDVTTARDALFGLDNSYGSNVKRTISETYVYARGVKLKTDNLPSDPASATGVNGARDYLAGTGYTGSTDSLHATAVAVATVTNNSFTSTDRTTLASIKSTEDSNRSDIVAVRAKTDYLPSDPASNSHIDSVVGVGANAFTSDDRDRIVAIKAKTDNLPPDPASTSSGFQQIDRDVVGSIRTKTDYLPPDPASNTAITNAVNSLKGTGQKDLSQIDADVHNVGDLVIAMS